MKGKLLAAGLLAVMAIGQSADAKTLEEILKEKGVITEADYKEVIKSRPLDYKLGRGFTFTSPNEKFQMTLGGRMQFRYTFTDLDEANYSSTKKDSSTWDARRIRLSVQGYAYSKDLTYKMEIDPRAYAKDTKTGLVDAYLNYKIVDEAQIRVGQFKDSFGRQEVTSDGALMFVDRSIVADAFKHSYDIGAMLHGKIVDGIAQYNLGVYGGAGQTNTRDSNDNAFFARVAVNPLGDMAYDEPDFARSSKPLVSVGASYLRNTLNKSAATTVDSTASNVSGWVKGVPGNSNNFIGNATDKIDTDSYGIDMAFKWMGASVQAEYMLGEAEAQVSGAKKRAHGYYAQAGYMITPKLGLAFRYSYLDSDRDQSNNTKTEQIGSVSYYFDKHNLKLQGDIGNIHTQKSATSKADDLQFRVQAQLIF